MAPANAIRRRWTAENIRFITREDHARPRYELIDGEVMVTLSLSVALRRQSSTFCTPASRPLCDALTSKRLGPTGQVSVQSWRPSCSPNFPGRQVGMDEPQEIFHYRDHGQ